jgi:hypothetical protein
MTAPYIYGKRYYAVVYNMSFLHIRLALAKSTGEGTDRTEERRTDLKSVSREHTNTTTPETRVPNIHITIKHNTSSD